MDEAVKLFPIIEAESKADMTKEFLETEMFFLGDIEKTFKKNCIKIAATVFTGYDQSEN